MLRELKSPFLSKSWFAEFGIRHRIPETTAYLNRKDIHTAYEFVGMIYES